ncbi:hypothetical protein ACHHYP_06988 [Achlya hypogyna]|uniref:Uncharacterized protein n=1 Tax=Achlya hypogyna TaxID=1202772 RepID=A0A1V9YR78_ACHHY|nr:hypothetical protein ACHHYP_06988 [Achlya hypogyna]
MTDPMGYVVTTVMGQSITYLFQHADLLEEFRMALVPGALSDESAATLRAFFARDTSVAELISLLFVDPKLPPTRSGTPTYAECANLYFIQHLMTTPPFTAGVLDSFLRPSETRVARSTLVNLLGTYTPLTAMNAEALSRVLTALFERATIPTFFALFGSDAVTLFEGLLFQAGRECIKELVLRVCDELLPSPPSLWANAPYRILHQIFPRGPAAGEGRGRLPDCAADFEYRFPLMLYTCDFITDLVQEQRPGSLGLLVIEAFTTDDDCARALVAGVLHDLASLPTALSCESYGMKILNSLLQMHHCGCIQHIQGTEASVECQGALNAVWEAVAEQLPRFVAHLVLPPSACFALKHVQMLYLLYPIIRVCCIRIDRQLIALDVVNVLLDLVERFPRANILHSAVCRLFITCLEDAPILFGEELRSPRTMSDPLRLAALAATDRVIAGARKPAPACFKDIAMSYDEFFHQKPAVAANLQERWQAFATTELEAVRQQWTNSGADVAPFRKHLPGKVLDTDVDSLLALAQKPMYVEEAPAGTSTPSVCEPSTYAPMSSEVLRLALAGSSPPKEKTSPRIAPLPLHTELHQPEAGRHHLEVPVLKTIPSDLSIGIGKTSPTKDSPLHALYNREEHQIIQDLG